MVRPVTSYEPRPLWLWREEFHEILTRELQRCIHCLGAYDLFRLGTYSNTIPFLQLHTRVDNEHPRHVSQSRINQCATQSLAWAARETQGVT